MFFPGAVPVPVSFFNAFTPVLANEKSDHKARVAVGLSLGTLLKFNLSERPFAVAVVPVLLVALGSSSFGFGSLLSQPFEAPPPSSLFPLP